jgi:hypothetical protein
MSIREQIGLTGFAIGIPLLLAWVKIRIWEWQASRERR